jgi:hypothetical protein
MVKPIEQRERALINLYAHWQFELDPLSFYTKWDVTYEQIAVICSRSLSTVRLWFGRGKNYRAPSACVKRHLALMDFLLEHFDSIPPELLFRLCPESRELRRRR